VKLNLADGTDGSNRTHRLQSWRVTAWAHWLFRQLDPGTSVRVCLYANAGYAYWEGTGRLVNRLTSTMQTLVHSQLEVIGGGQLLAKEASVEK